MGAAEEPLPADPLQQARAHEEPAPDPDAGPPRLGRGARPRGAAGGGARCRVGSPRGSRRGRRVGAPMSSTGVLVSVVAAAVLLLVENGGFSPSDRPRRP